MFADGASPEVNIANMSPIVQLLNALLQLGDRRLKRSGRAGGAEGLDCGTHTGVVSPVSTEGSLRERGSATRALGCGAGCARSCKVMLSNTAK